eukprot:646253-Pleurochrysis_carterae.AAC.2
MACFRVRGSAVVAEAAKAQPVFRPHCCLSPRGRSAKSAASRDRNGHGVIYGRRRWGRRNGRRVRSRRCRRHLTRFGGYVSRLWYGAVQS